MDNHNISELLPRYFEGKLNPEESRRVEEWIESSSDNEAIATDMAQAYHHLDSLYALEQVRADEALKEVRHRIRSERWQLFMRRLERVAAVLFVPLLLVSGWQYYFWHRGQQSRLITLATNPGMTSSATLPDGTVVTLNSETRLSYPSTFSGDTREVALDGEAYFAVAKDRRHPFVVNTPHSPSVTAYGTHFNVEAYAGDNKTTATLVEGSISMTFIDHRDRQHQTFLEPGQSISYSNLDRQVKVWSGDADVITAWKDGKLIFHNTPVAAVLNSLSKRFGVTFVVKNPQVYNNSFTGTLENQRLDRILEYLVVASDMHFKYMVNGDLKQKKQQILVY